MDPEILYYITQIKFLDLPILRYSLKLNNRNPFRCVAQVRRQKTTKHTKLSNTFLQQTGALSQAILSCFLAYISSLYSTGKWTKSSFMKVQICFRWHSRQHHISQEITRVNLYMWMYLGPKIATSCPWCSSLESGSHWSCCLAKKTYKLDHLDHCS